MEAFQHSLAEESVLPANVDEKGEWEVVLTYFVLKIVVALNK
jgi:hypothetical protein